MLESSKPALPLDVYVQTPVFHLESETTYSLPSQINYKLAVLERNPFQSLCMKEQWLIQTSESRPSSAEGIMRRATDRRKDTV